MAKGDWYAHYNSSILLHTKASSPVGCLNLLCKCYPDLLEKTIKELEEEGYKIKKREIK